MAENPGKAGKSALWAWLALAAAALALNAAPFLFLLIDGDTGAAVYVIHLYAVLPLAALTLPFFAAKRGAHPLAAFFPIGLCLLFSPIYKATGVAIACLCLSLVGAVAGGEWRKRALKGKKHEGKKHGK